MTLGTNDPSDQWPLEYKDVTTTSHPAAAPALPACHHAHAAWREIWLLSVPWQTKKYKDGSWLLCSMIISYFSVIITSSTE